MDISWDDARLFLAVAEAGSLSAAARRLGLGQPTVTRRLALLEYTVGATLFRRSVEGATLTFAGERLLTPAKKMAEWAGELHRAAEAPDGAPAGLVRVTSSPFICFDFLAPFAGAMAVKTPGLRLEVLSSVQYLDLVRGEADLALRSLAPTSAELQVLFSLRVKTQVMVAASLQKRLPKKVTLASLPWVAWAPPFEAVPPNPQLAAAIPNFRPAFSADHFLVQLAAAEAGAGALVLAGVRHRLSRPTTLVPLELDLGEYGFSNLHLVCAKSALDIPRVRLVADMLIGELKTATS
jgi:DNA-binding transcriptional LysR family regulator